MTALVLVCTALCLGGCSGSSDKGEILLVVESRLAAELQENVTQLATDMRAEHYKVQIEQSLPASAKPAEIRETLRKRWQGSSDLRGAILIGEFGAPFYNTAVDAGDPYWHDHLVDLYYMDLDGGWLDSNGDGVFDKHVSYTGGKLARVISWIVEGVPVLDRRSPEIWVSRIRAGTLYPLGNELDLYHDYFRRNHAYRTGAVKVPPRAFMVAPGSRFTASDWGARPAQLYPDVAISECQAEPSATLRKDLTDPQGWALGIVGSFSGPQVHKFSYYEGPKLDESWFQSPGGHLLIAEYSMLDHKPHDVTSKEIASLKPNVYFYQLLSSETGRHDQVGYLGGTYLFFGSGLGVIAGTQHSGAIGVPMLYEEFAEGKSLGEAWREAIVWSLKHNGPNLTQHWCDRDVKWDPSVDIYKAVLLGDGTLHLPSAGAAARPRQ